ncbi:MAG: DNA polymerase III subunit delta' [Hyphomicrobiaceae bacterium]|nr:DNA polymerase III subunit delta' [Hyphomicrobiaceae bacterium]
MARAPAQHEDEMLPEADRLAGFPHPRETRKLVGHAHTEAELAQAFARGRMHHAWLIAGPEGIGKATLAYGLARHVLAPRAERDASASTLEIQANSATARQIRALAHPGLLVLRRPYDVRSKRHAASIPVDEVRRLKAFLGLTAADGAWRVVIVDAADQLNVNAANALLKSLEEPPSRALFLLIASQPSRLLPTVRSRCRGLQLAPLTGTALRQASETALAAAEMDLPGPDRWPLLERLAEGSVRKALLLAGSGGLELYERIEAVLAALPRIDWPAAHALADQLGQPANEQRFEAFYDLLLEMLWRLVRARALASTGAPENALGQRLIPATRLPAWAALWEDIGRERAEAALLNLDKRALVLGTFAKLERIAQP